MLHCTFHGWEWPKPLDGWACVHIWIPPKSHPPIITSPFYGSPKLTDPSFNQAFEVFRGTGKAAMAGSQLPRKNLKMPVERLAPRKDD